MGRVADVSFGTDPFQGTDFYFPEVASDTSENARQHKSQRMVVFVHGGAWRVNARSDFTFIGETFSKKHLMPVAIAGYRLSAIDKETGVPKVRHPSHVSDAASAIAWILASTVHRLPSDGSFPELAIQANKAIHDMGLKELVVVGHSAGAQIGGLIALNPKFLEDALIYRFNEWKIPQHDENMSLINKIIGYVGCEGIYDIPKLVEEYSDYTGFVVQAFGEKEGGLWEDGSPSRATPKLSTQQTAFRPHLVLQSQKDELLTSRQSEIWMDHLKRFQISCAYDDHTLVGLHDDWTAQSSPTSNHMVIDLIIELLSKVLNFIWQTHRAMTTVKPLTIGYLNTYILTGGYYYLTNDNETIFGAVRGAPDSDMIKADIDAFILHLAARYDEFTPTASKVLEEQKYFGIIGLIDLDFEKLVIVVTDRELAARLKGRSVWRVAGIKFISVFKKSVLSLDQEEHVKVTSEALTRLFTAGQSFYSIDVDLTNGPQRFLAKGYRQQSTLNFPNFDSESVLRHMERRFLFNRNILAPILRPKAGSFILPIVHGFVGSTTLAIGTTKIHIVVISRVGTGRAGLNFRGIDEFGEAAGEVETETIIFSRKRISAFRIVRGSVPLFWISDDIDDPDGFQHLNSPESISALKAHLERLREFYGGDVSVVDLLRLDVKHEVTLGKALEDSLLELNCKDVEYFHCNGSAINPSSDSLIRFLKELQRSLSKQHFFSCAIDGQGAFIGNAELQRGIYRVNCIDGMDLSNLVQYSLTMEAIGKMLEFMGLPSKISKAERTKVGLLWAANGDSLSMNFLGTYSLNSSRILYTSWNSNVFSRSIQRARDAFIQISRTYLDKIQSDNRQEAYDILFGGESLFDGEPIEDLESGDDETSASEKTKRAIMKRKCITLSEHSQATPIAALLLLRRLLAPKEVKSAGTFGAAFVWVIMFKILKKINPDAMPFQKSTCTGSVSLSNGLGKGAPYRSSIADILDTFTAQTTSTDLVYDDIIEHCLYEVVFETHREDRLYKAPCQICQTRAAAMSTERNSSPIHNDSEPDETPEKKSTNEICLNITD
ncbi:hypothetical protein HDU67_006456 [Dinochytrium kinnereticum]|nr:hypothetical protein HDU67_006456 [Dinochytrium kinnereticum]